MAQATQEHQVPSPAAPAVRARRAHSSAPVPASPVRLRRRPALVGLGVALVALGGLTSAWLVRSTAATVPVVRVAAAVERGEVVERGDVALVDVRVDPSVPVVAAADLESVVGQVAVTGLLPGTLLAPDALTDQLLPGPGASLVGVALTPAQRPAGLLVPGDAVRVVATPAAQADVLLVVPDATAGQVVAVTAPDPAGVVTVDVLVPAQVAADLAARSATGRVALVLDARER